ncbi:MAG: geranylgeranylglycerol-phosphate geranylgeranyltransferase [Bacteroidales bacterium]|nr:geranylgeranylglycerol-phosphate geranylgeranyltransferase [Bacteroidales bacterium]
MDDPRSLYLVNQKQYTVIKAFFQLIRWPNQLILILSMYLMYVPIVQHMLGPEVSAAGMNDLTFVLLVVTTLLLAAGGYIINDLMDVEADRINKPGKNTVNTVFTVRQAEVLYAVTTAIGILTGTWVSFRVHTPVFSLLFVFTAGLMWFYAKDYQCRPILGNLVVAFPSAFSFGLVFIFQVLAIQSQMGQVLLTSHAFTLVFILNLIYIGFALLVSWLREIVKDVEDMKGDQAVGCRTFAVVYGYRKSKNLALGIALTGLMASFFIQWIFYSESLMLLFFYFFLVDLLFSLILYKLVNARETFHFSSLSLWIKLLMLTGVLSMALFYFGG